MNAIDTNILLYRFDRTEASKRFAASSLVRNLARQTETLLLWQVAAELQNQLHRWEDIRRIPPGRAVQLTRVIRRMFRLVLPNEAVLDRSALYMDRFSLSHWDAMIVAACAEAGATTLYTEDMGAPRRVDVVDLVNPFLAG